jgi:hypothetical protein
MNPDVVLGQLFVLRAQVEVLIRMVEPETVPAPEAEDEGCPHPEDKRVDVSVMDGQGPRWQCLLCEQEFAGAL